MQTNLSTPARSTAFPAVFDRIAQSDCGRRLLGFMRHRHHRVMAPANLLCHLTAWGRRSAVTPCFRTGRKMQTSQYTPCLAPVTGVDRPKSSCRGRS